MTVEQTDVVDFIGVDKSSGEVVLTISDHLDWDTDVEHHIRALAEKLNAYLGFVESGEILERYPGAQGRKVKIEVISRCPLNAKAQEFYDYARQIVLQDGIELCLSHLQED